MFLDHPYFSKTTKAAPLAAFRIFFGIMMLASIVRFWSYGWIDKLYIQPTFFFSYYGFEFVKPLGGYTYLLFFVCGLAALAVALGYQYRLAIITFFLSFTYIELTDKTTYLNHYYFISLLSFLMIFLPANTYFSLDAKSNESRRYQYIPQWSADAIKLLLAIVYVYAGLAKLNSDWLVEAMPLKLWLPAAYDLPLLGDWFQKTPVIYFFSWAGAAYDLSIPFLLLYRRTRTVAFLLVVIFHVLTRILFPIGMFPYIMIVSALLFFDARLHEKLLSYPARWLKTPLAIFDNGRHLAAGSVIKKKLILSVLSVFFLFQFLFPFRYLAYPGELFWTEEGFRFSWRVMLIEKAGYAGFRVTDNAGGRSVDIDNSRYLTPFQEKQMTTQPDFIIQYAHFLEREFEKKHMEDVSVYVDSYVTLNGRRSRRYIDPSTDLTKVTDSFKHKNWILPFDDDIKGL